MNFLNVYTFNMSVFLFTCTHTESKAFFLMQYVKLISRHRPDIKTNDHILNMINK